MEQEANNGQSDFDAFARAFGQSEQEPKREEDSEEQDGDNPSLDQQEDNSPKYKVVVNGVESEVPLKELVAGYQRQQDYTHKTQELSSRNKELAEFQGSVQQKYQEAATFLDALIQVAQAPLKTEDELLHIALTDPQKAQRLELEQRLHRRQIDQLMAKRQQLQTEQEQLQLHYGERFLRDNHPHLLQPETKTAIATYLTGSGYKPQELNGLTDPRAIVIAEKAMKWDELQKKSAQIKKGLTPEKTLQPTGAQPQPKQSRAFNDRKQRLRQTGSIRDAAKVFNHIVKF